MNIMKPLYVLHDEHYETIICPTWWTLWNHYTSYMMNIMKLLYVSTHM